MYGTVAEVSAAFDADQWDPATDAPETATVTDWLTAMSTQLDGEIGHVVTCPVDSGDSPNLYEVCSRITVLRVQARVAETAIGGAEGREMAKAFRAEAMDLVKGIQRGATGDGTALSDRPENPGAPTGYFGDDTTPHTRLGGKW